MAHMLTGEMPPYCSSTTQGHTKSLDCPEASLPSDSASTTRTVVIGLKANQKLRVEIFGHSRNYLGDLTDSRLVVVDCVSKLRDELGFNWKADDQMFAGANERKLAAELKKQHTDLNIFLTSFRYELEESGCRFDILTRPGRASADILIQTAKALNPHLVLLELSFAKDRKRIQRELQCNVALMKKNPLETPQIFEFTPKYGSIDSLHDPDCQESDNPSERLGCLNCLGSSFAKDRKRIRRELQCNVALMKKNPLETPQIFEFTPKYPGSIDSSHDPDSQESDNPRESTVDPEALDSIPEMSPSRLPFHRDVPFSSSLSFALEGHFVKNPGSIDSSHDPDSQQSDNPSESTDALMKVKGIRLPGSP